MYVGALPLMLAAVALILRRTPERVAVALFGALWFAVVVGIPPVVQIVTRAAAVQLGAQHPPDHPHDPARVAAGRLGPRRPHRRAQRLAGRAPAAALLVAARAAR